ncbi:MAG TPA: FAD-dependent oxidoreductase, partial [Steroidobacteraceae bacterium]
MGQQDTIAVIGSGIIGAAVALALAREGRRVLLLDRAEPGTAGGSFGNVGHIAAELAQPLPSPALLFGFWRMLARFGGPVDLPPHRALHMLPWIARFAAAAFRRTQNTAALAPLVLPAASTWARWLQEINRPELLRCHGHYEIALGARSLASTRAQAAAMARLGIRTSPVSAQELLPLQRAAGARTAAG